ncbi:hypothetical protein FRC04_005084 [Tulasnella sp. 424]|nr:hypothetical protein FRC04_005084 [Tulasnella sp. 424]KAG8964751.1 hypothetical protein FRC05_003591 [Tulasnella sp. 425]
MQKSSRLNEPSETVIDEISKSLVSAIGEANKWNFRLRCKNLSDPKLSDGVQLAEHIRALQLAEVVIKRDLNRRIANARRHQNALRPVNKLPDEVLSVVFHQVAATVSIFNHFTSLSNIAGVSARWKSIVDSTPTLWSFVSSTYPESQVDRALKKSARTPLSVACRFKGEELTSSLKYESREFLQVMQSKGRHWDELTLRLPRIGHLRAVLEAPSSHLRKLDIKVAYASFKKLNLFGGLRGVLEDVKLTNANIEWNSEAFTGLRTLQLDYSAICDSDVLPSVTQLSWLLEHNPGLRFLSLSGWITEGPTPDDPTTLPHLTRLCLKAMPSDTAAPVLRSLWAPSCTHFTLHCESGTGYTALLTELEAFLPSLRESLEQAASISICLGPSHFHYHTVPRSTESPSKLDFRLDSMPPYLLLELFCHQLHEYNVKTSPIHIRIDPRFDFTCSGAILPSLFRLRNVVNLKVADRVVAPCRLLKWLSWPYSIQGDQELWPLPNLVEVEIGQSNLTLRDIRDFVRGRYGKRSEKKQPRGLMPLKVLRTVGNDWDDTWVQPDIRRLLPQTDCSFQRSSWAHSYCEINAETTDTDEEEEGASEVAGSHESSIVDSESTDETSDSDSEVSDDSDEGTEES